MKLKQFAFAALLGATMSVPVFAQPGQGMGPGGGPGMGYQPRLSISQNPFAL